MKRWQIFIGAGLLLASFLSAQSLQERLESLASENAKGYLQPFSDALGANLNSGLYHSAKIGKGGLHVYVGAEVIGALIVEDQQVYKAKVLNALGQTVEIADAPTIFGSKDGKTVQLGPGQTYALPGGMDLRLFPVVAPRIQIGNFLGTELIVRWVELNLPEDFGKFSMKGYGLRHSLSQYIPLFPINVALGFFAQDLRVGDVVKVTTNYLGLQASKRFMALELYGGAGIESSHLKVEYQIGVPVPGVTLNQPVSLSLDGKNRSRLNVGATFHLLFLKLHADYNIAPQKTVVIGAGIGL